MIFVDSNIPMYLIGADHPNKERALVLLEQLVSDGERLVTDVAVFQEILHRYSAISRRDAIAPAFDALAEVVDEVFGLGFDDVLAAKQILTTQERISARDALHVAVMRRESVGVILSFDRGFDQLPELRRLS